jgi:hypothetical protein
MANTKPRTLRVPTLQLNVRLPMRTMKTLVQMTKSKEMSMSEIVRELIDRHENKLTVKNKATTHGKD